MRHRLKFCLFTGLLFSSLANAQDCDSPNDFLNQLIIKRQFLFVLEGVPAEKPDDLASFVNGQRYFYYVLAQAGHALVADYVRVRNEKGVTRLMGSDRVMHLKKQIADACIDRLELMVFSYESGTARDRLVGKASIPFVDVVAALSDGQAIIVDADPISFKMKLVVSTEGTLP